MCLHIAGNKLLINRRRLGKQDNQIREVQIQFTEFLLCSANKIICNISRLLCNLLSLFKVLHVLRSCFAII